MTWGSNPTWRTTACRHCGADQIDDGNPPTHERTCRYRHWLARVVRWLLVDDDRQSDQKPYEEGYDTGRAGTRPTDEQWNSSTFWRYGWLWGRIVNLHEQIKEARAETYEARAETVDRIHAAIDDVRVQAAKRRKEDEEHFIEIIKEWQERTYAAERSLDNLRRQWWRAGSQSPQNQLLLLTWEGEGKPH